MLLDSAVAITGWTVVRALPGLGRGVHVAAIAATLGGGASMQLIAALLMLHLKDVLASPHFHQRLTTDLTDPRLEIPLSSEKCCATCSSGYWGSGRIIARR